MSLRFLKKSISAAIVGLALLFFSLAAIHGQNLAGLGGVGPSVATIDQSQGGFEILRADGLRREPAQKGMNLFLGDRIETDASGMGKVVFIDKSVLSVGKSTTLKITQYLFNAEEKSRSATLHLIIGEIRMRVEPHLNWNPFRPYQYQVRTGSLVAGVRGTDFIVRSMASGLSEIYALEGVLALKGTEGNGDMVTLTGQFFSQTPLGSWPSQPLKFEPAKLQTILSGMGEVAASTPIKTPGAKTAAAPAKNAVLTQGEWAQMLSETLGLAETMPQTDDKSLYVDLLTGGKSKTMEAESTQYQSNYLAKEQSSGASDGNYLQAKSLSGSLRMNTVMTKTGKYPLKIRSRGTVLVSVGNQTIVVESSPDQKDLEWKNLGQFQFEGGTNAINVVVSRGSAVDALQIDSRCADPIVPAGGWAAGDDLNYAQKAETMVKAMDQEGSLPLDNSYTQILRADNSQTIQGDYEKVEMTMKGKTGSGKRRVVRAGTGSAAVNWQINLPADGIYSFSVQAAGTAPLSWTADGCNIAKHIPEYTELNEVWEDVVSRNLPKGAHSLDIQVPAGSTIDSVRIVKRRGQAEDYLALLNSLGFQEGAKGEKVTQEGARKNLENEFFKNFVGKKVGDEITGIPSTPEEIAEIDPVYLPDEDFPYGSPASPILPGIF